MEGKEIRQRHVSVPPDSRERDREETQSTKKRRFAFPLRRSVLLSLLPFVAVLVLFARLFFTSGDRAVFLIPTTHRHPESGEASWSHVDTRIQQNGLLHPEHHAYRAATTQTLNWRVTTAQRRPDGVLKTVFVINDLFPGPTIEARSGDSLNILVHNDVQDEEISLHWHGLEMRDANTMDGSIGVTQCGIPPGHSFWYNFTISPDQSGTFWYHAHSSVQRVDGLYGGLVVHKPATTLSLDRFGRATEQRNDAQADSSNYHYDKELLLLIGDWYHRPARDVASWYLWWGSMGFEPVPDSMLVNGAGRFNCSMAMPGRPIDCVGDANDTPPVILDGKGSYRLRVVNTGSLAGITVGFAKEGLDVITLDGGLSVETKSDEQDKRSAGILFPGQRMDVVIRPSKQENSMGPSLMTVKLDESDFKIGNPSLKPRQSFPVLKSPKHTDEKPLVTTDLDEKRHINIEKIPSASSVRAVIPPKAQETHLVYTKVEKLSRLANIPHGFFNRTTWKKQSDPPYPLAGLARKQWDKHQLSIATGPEPVWVDLVINNLDEGAHPFHLHGHNFYVIALHESTFGWGSYNPWDEKSRIAAGNPSVVDSQQKDADPYDLSHAVLRDTVQIPRRGYAVLRFRADNPGVWLFHCHVMWHLAGGMAMIVDVGSADDSTAHQPWLSATEEQQCRV